MFCIDQQRDNRDLVPLRRLGYRLDWMSGIERGPNVNSIQKRD